MTWFHISIAANIIFSVVIGIFALDRRFFRQTCELRHNPIDDAIERIEHNIEKIWDKLNE
jgi:hypothetical protein